ncbi:hypothetical protein ACFL3C_01935 [Patescibacteria group bacterium]
MKIFFALGIVSTFIMISLTSYNIALAKAAVQNTHYIAACME